MTKRTCSFRIEKSLSGITCGLDEAGRGPLAGPVVAACVYVHEDYRRKRFWSQVDDSKKLKAQQREDLYASITEHCYYGIAEASVEEIDTINILHASMLAMSRAMDRMIAEFSVAPVMALVDGNYPPKLPCTVQTVIQGDATSLSIAAASILAKVTRDCLMKDLCAQHPGYGWSNNAGYGTPEHLAGLKSHGVTIHHRRSFAPVMAAMAEQDNFVGNQG
ncbi:MAG: Ribonuclease [Micavibrio sp.]|nr:Ribonuclease [Micavibrio sp.]